MKLSLRSEYALLALISLSRSSIIQSLPEVASAQQIPVESLAEIFSVLSRSNYLEQVEAGFRLKQSPATISVADIIRIFDGALAPLEPVSAKGYVLAAMDKEEKLSGLFEKIQGQILVSLETTNIADLV